MVLHHIAQRARPVVVAAAALKPNGLGHGDLHVVDHVGGPQTLENRVGEAQRQQVLDRFLAEEMIDAENLVFGKDRADLLVDLARRGQVPANRLFQDHAGIGGREAMCADIAADRAIQVGRRGQVEHPYAPGVQQASECLPVAALAPRRVERDIGKACQEAPQRFVIERIGGNVLGERFLGAAAEALIAQIGPCGADDARIVGDLAVAAAVVQRRQQLAQRQVAGGAEHHAVERLDRNDL